MQVVIFTCCEHLAQRVPALNKKSPRPIFDKHLHCPVHRHSKHISDEEPRKYGPGKEAERQILLPSGYWRIHQEIEGGFEKDQTYDNAADCSEAVQIAKPTINAQQFPDPLDVFRVGETLSPEADAE